MTTLSSRRCATNRITIAVACRLDDADRLIETGCRQRCMTASILLLGSSSADLIFNCWPIPNDSNRLLLNCL